MESWRSLGRRVLLFAYHPQAQLTLRDGDDQPRLPEDLQPLCLLNFSDELRPKVQETLKRFVDAGIGLKFISGDNPETVAGLVRQAGFVEEDHPLTLVSGLELAEMDESQIRQNGRQSRHLRPHYPATERGTPGKSAPGPGPLRGHDRGRHQRHPGHEKSQSRHRHAEWHRGDPQCCRYRPARRFLWRIARGLPGGAADS